MTNVPQNRVELRLLTIDEGGGWLASFPDLSRRRPRVRVPSARQKFVSRHPRKTGNSLIEKNFRSFICPMKMGNKQKKPPLVWVTLWV